MLAALEKQCCHAHAHLSGPAPPMQQVGCRDPAWRGPLCSHGPAQGSQALPRPPLQAYLPQVPPHLALLEALPPLPLGPESRGPAPQEWAPWGPSAQR